MQTTPYTKSLLRLAVTKAFFFISTKKKEFGENYQDYNTFQTIFFILLLKTTNNKNNTHSSFKLSRMKHIQPKMNIKMLYFILYIFFVDAKNHAHTTWLKDRFFMFGRCDKIVYEKLKW